MNFFCSLPPIKKTYSKLVPRDNFTVPRLQINTSIEFATSIMMFHYGNQMSALSPTWAPFFSL